MSTSINNNLTSEGKPPPPKPTDSTATLPFISNYMMALLNSIQTTTDNMYVQQKADAETLSMEQRYMQSVQKNWTDRINGEISQATQNNTFDSAEVARVNMLQAQMSTEVDKANSAVGSMKSTLSNDITNASQILNFFEGLTTITGFTAGLLR